MELIDTYISKFEECLKIVDYGSSEKKRDTAFLMTLTMVNASGLTREKRNAILFDLAYYAVIKKEIITNLKDEVSANTSLSINYSPFEGVMVFLSSESYLNIDTISYIYNELSSEYKKYSGGSCMNDCVHNVAFYGFNCATLDNCLNAAKKARKK
ncbi:hypothetical protein [Corallincola spongiicola]|uniref:Uncharacterized protein n=1 Tax=Corallincola spongiicola TaxID=2520508 RepID=A0ABY1WMC2_9GAMM|nr:hypothetical protein [Corallincola spongiicola]TAA42627.1 hypothetical protein EXY25_15165 [Corallincola spongiicola]